jgi:hypothetical protein
LLGLLASKVFGFRIDWLDRPDGLLHTHPMRAI